MNKTKLIAYLFLIVTFVGVSIANGGQLQKNDFSISLPDGWVEIPRDMLDRKERELAKSTNLPISNCHIDYGFQLESSKNWFELPYITIQIQNTGRFSEKELESFQNYSYSQKDNEDIEKKGSSMVNNMEFGKIVYDKNTKTLWTRSEANVANRGPVSVISGEVLTEKGFIAVVGASLKKDYPTYESVFISVALSVIPKPGLAYKPKW